MPRKRGKPFKKGVDNSYYKRRDMLTRIHRTRVYHVLNGIHKITVPIHREKKGKEKLKQIFEDMIPEHQKPLSPEEAAAEADLRKLEEELAHRYLNEPYRYFEPTGKGEEFINLIGSDRYFISLFSAANGIGKTAQMICTLANLMYPVGNPFFQQKLFKDGAWPYKKKGRIVSDPTNIEKNIVPELEKWFPKGRWTAKKNNRPFNSQFVTDTGWEFDVMTYEQDEKEFEGVNLGFVWLDEPPPKSIYKACVSRLRKGGCMWITATPIGDSAWLYDEIIANPDNEAGQRAFIEADVESACKQHGVRGHLEHRDIERMIAQYDDVDMQARVLGKFQHLTGLVFKQFKKNIHVIKGFIYNPNELTVYEALDCHPRTEDAVLWVGVDRAGKKFVLDELFINGTDEQICYNIKKKASQFYVRRRIADPSMWIEDQHTGKSLATRFASYGLSYIKASKAREAADRRIGQALQHEAIDGCVVRAPELYILEHCTRLIWELEHYIWDNWKGKTADKKGLKQKPVDKDDHLIEDLGRILIQEPEFIAPPANFTLDDSSLIPTFNPLSTDDHRGVSQNGIITDPYAR